MDEPATDRRAGQDGRQREQRQREQAADADQNAR